MNLQQLLQDWIGEEQVKESVGRTLLKRELRASLPSLLAKIEQHVLEARKDELQHLVADTLEPEQVGGMFIHKEVKEFASQQKQFIATRLRKLDALLNTKEPTHSQGETDHE